MAIRLINKIPTLFVFLLLCGTWALPVNFSFSESNVDQLKKEIDQKNQEIEDIEKEIEKYQTEIDNVLEEKKTLKNEISYLETTANKLRAEISLTEKKINNTDLSIREIEFEIQIKNNQIQNKKEGLSEIIRALDEQESQSLLEILLANDNLSDFFGDIQRMEYLQKDITLGLTELRDLKQEKETEQINKRDEKSKLEGLQNKLEDQKAISDSNKNKKNNLLVQTNNKEENYKNILKEILAQKESFEKEMAQLEAQLRIEIDPASLPPVGSGILAWPLDEIKITQYFGNTPFATQNPQVYNGKGHTGVDFRASVGTPVKSAGGGVVVGMGNTDLVKGCYSYGKWVLIKHNTGLSTLYAHLSLMKVSEGQMVTTGQIIGYSGQTGYATGPHLHFGVYASQGVQITKFENSVNCKNAYVPIAPIEAYLNPLSYL